MKVLNINKYYYRKGGAEAYYFGLSKMLEDYGHDVISFSMNHEKNERSEYEKYFINKIDYYEQTTIKEKILNAGKIIYSFEASKKLEDLIKAEKPDIAHLQNFHHQMSVSIVDVLKKHSVPVVYTAHDLKLVCGNYKMMVDNQICERCKGGKHYNCFKRACVKGSRLGSLVNTIEMYLAQLKGTIDKIDYIITPSSFYKEKLEEFGIDSKKIVHIPNFVEFDDMKTDINKKSPGTSQGYFVYFGRVSEEKGLFTLIKAMKDVDDIQLKVIGSGPLLEDVKNMIGEYNLSRKVELLGYKSGEELKALLQGAKFNVLPSEWYENGPYSVLEMMWFGKPTIASDIGGLPDNVIHEKTGLLFQARNVEQLSSAINRLSTDESLLKSMGKNCYNMVRTVNSTKAYYDKLINIYRDLT